MMKQSATKARRQNMRDKLTTCPHCIYEKKGKCELSSEYVSDRQYCDEADDGDYEKDDNDEGHDI